MTDSLLAQNGIPDLSTITERACAARAKRVNGIDYTSEEIAEIERLDRRLFSSEFEISEEARESLRVLCTYSRCELRPSPIIRSHRKLIGPAIVFLKKLSWPLVRFHLKDTFESIELFHSSLVYSYARQVQKLEQIERKERRLPTT